MGEAKKKKSVPFKASKTNPLWVWLIPLTWIVYILDIVFFILSIIYPLKWLGSFFKGAQSTPVPGGKGKAHRWRLKSGLLTDPMPSPGVTTAHEMLQESFKLYASKNACGTRAYKGTYQGPKDKFPRAKFGETSFLTYADLNAKITAFGAGLVKLGTSPFTGTPAEYEAETDSHTIMIYENTSQWWTIASVGAWSQSITVATSYATLGISSVAQAVNETNSSCIVCNYNDVKKVVALAKECPGLKTVVWTPLNVEEEKLSAPPVEGDTGGLQVLSMDAVIQMGMENPIDFSPPKPETVAVVMYTSGSTGSPKGVLLKHSCLVASVAGMFQTFPAGNGIRPGVEVYLAYLPAAHILELVAENTMLSRGALLGYADPKTLSSKGAAREMPDGTVSADPIPKPQPNASFAPGAIQEFCPTIMAGVPKVWDIFKKGAEEKLSAPGAGVLRYLIQMAFSWRARAVANHRASPITFLIFKKFRNLLGGRLRIALTGGGPCSSEVQTFVRTGFCPIFIQGYALTETCCAGTVQLLSDCRDGVVGPPLGSVEIQLVSVDIEDSVKNPYKNTDTKHTFKLPGGKVGSYPCIGRGEVCIRGPSVSAGYFKLGSKTAESYVDFGDGGDVWFKSGDVGVFLPDGTLRIVDRVKNLLKLKGGEYIAIENMEVVYGNSSWVDGMNGGIMCYGNGDMDRPVAILQGNLYKIKEYATEAGIAYSSDAELCRNESLKATVLKDLQKAGDAGGLSPIEKLCAVLICTGEGDDETPISLTSKWTPENGALTATRKLNRNPIKDAVEAEFDALIAKGIR